MLLDKLSSLHGLENRKELYKTHTKPVLDSFQDTYTIWSTHSVERLIFDVLVIEAGKHYFWGKSTKMNKINSTVPLYRPVEILIKIHLSQDK